MKSGIYRIKNKITGKVYIGKSIDISSRIHQHQLSFINNTCNYKILEDVRLYGIDIFEFKVLKKTDNLEYFEGHYIRMYDSIKKGYNIANVADHNILNNIDCDKILEIFIKKLKKIDYNKNTLTLEISKINNLLGITPEQMALMIRLNSSKFYDNDMRCSLQGFNKYIDIVFSIKEFERDQLSMLLKAYD